MRLLAKNALLEDRDPVFRPIGHRFTALFNITGLFDRLDEAAKVSILPAVLYLVSILLGTKINIGYIFILSPPH